MSVPEGFKQTEVGVIPKDWEIHPLESITDTTRPISYGIVQTGACVTGGVRCLRVLDINNGKINKTNLITTSKQISIAYKRTVLKLNDLVMPLRGKVGDVGQIDRELVGCNLTRGVALIAIRPQWSAGYCRQVISSCSSRSRMEQLMNGSALQEIPIATLRSFKIPLPPTRAEQTAIATALSDIDALIEGVEKLLEKKRRIKQGTMQELLRPKEGWKEVLLGSIADILTGFPFASSGYSNDGIKLLRGSNVKRGNIDWSKDNTKYWKYITNDIKNYELQAGDVVIAMDGSLVGKSFAQISEHDIPALLLQRVARIRTDKVDINYISHLVCGNYFTIHCEQIKTSSAIPHISPKDIRDFQIPLPPTRAEQATIAAILSDMDSEIEELETQLVKYRQLKTGMMQELLTGKKRLV